MKLTVDQIPDSTHAMFGPGDRIFPWTTYQVTVTASEFKNDTTSTSSLSLLHDVGTTPNVVMASCYLTADSQRRGVRTGTLVVGDQAHAALFDQITDMDFTFHVTMGSDNTTVVYEHTGLTGIRRTVQGGGGGGGSSSSSMWTVVNGGAVSVVSSLVVGDMTQTSYDVTSASGNINIIPKVSGVTTVSGPFQAYVTFTTSDGSWSPLGDIKVNGSSVIWDYEDSKSYASTSWLLHLTTISGVWHGVLRAVGAPPTGVETDSDSDDVPGIGVNT